MRARYLVTVKVVVAFNPDVRPIAVIVMMPDAGAGPINGWGWPTKLPLASVSDQAGRVRRRLDAASRAAASASAGMLPCFTKGV